jgi:hypothetical protein
MQFTSIKQVASYVAKNEAKLKQVSIGNIREVLKILSKLCVTNTEVITLLVKNGKKQTSSKVKKAKKK